MNFLPETAANKRARIWYMRDDNTVLWQAAFMPYDPIPFYRGFEPLRGSYTIHVVWAEGDEG